MEQIQSKTGPIKTEIEKHLEKCLSMVLHHKEIQKIAEVIKLVFHERKLS